MYYMLIDYLMKPTMQDIKVVSNSRFYKCVGRKTRLISLCHACRIEFDLLLSLWSEIFKQLIFIPIMANGLQLNWVQDPLSACVAYRLKENLHFYHDIIFL